MVKLSYLVSSYDSGHFLDEHMSDLLMNQTDPDFEIVIVNPNSPGTDDAVARKWAQHDSRVNYIYHPEREWYGESWLRAWKAAKGRFVINSNTDDFHAPNTTETVHRRMSFACSPISNEENVGFGYGGITVVNEAKQIQGQGIKPPFDFELMTRECHAGPQVFWRNDNEFRDSLDWDHLQKRAKTLSSGFDYHLWLYFMSKGYRGHVIDHLLTIYTQRPDSIENSNKWLNNWDTFTSIAEYFPVNFKNHFEECQEFVSKWPLVPHRDTWSELMSNGKKWDDSYEWQEMD